MENFIKITSDVVFTSAASYGDETLVFEGGKFINNTSSPITLTGNNTKIIASPYQIFVGEFNFEGTWVTDRAYPQWFGAVTYQDIHTAASSGAISSTDAINKAIKFKQGGEVFCPKGVYLITNTPNSDIFVKNDDTNNSKTNLYDLVYAGINMTTGINLVGEYGNLVGTQDKNKDNRTVFVVKFDTNKIATYYPENPSNFAMLININQIAQIDEQPQWKQQYSPQGHSVRNIFFWNSTPMYGDRLLRGVLCGCGATFDCNTWSGFSQGVKYTNNYIDDKKIVNCTFNLNYASQAIDESKQLYAFDMGSLGDAMLFEHNQINEGYHNKGIRVNNCGGACINANVINADVLICNCKGITFSANHLEQGRQLKIESSNVTSSNNYFWRRSNPAIAIIGTKYKDKSVVTSNGDNFIFYDSIVYKNDKIKRELPYCAICEYDIAIDEFSVLNLSNAYRLWNGGGFGKMYTCGIKMCKIIDTENPDYSEYSGNIQPFDTFNSHSYALSQSCTIRAGHEIGSGFSIATFDPKNNFYYMSNAGVVWDYTTGYYTYDCQIVLDASRGLLLTKAGQTLIRMNNYGIGNTVHNIKDSNGILLILGRSGLNFNLRLIRKRYNDSTCTQVAETHFIDIPICGNVNIYDNGVSISGFKWEKADNNPVINGNAGITSVTFNGNNVVCYSSSDISQGIGWRTGDVIVNTGSQSTWVMKVIKQ